MKKPGFTGASLCAAYMLAASPHARAEDFPLPACTTKDGLKVTYKREDGSMAGPLYAIIEINQTSGKPEAFIYYDGADLGKFSAASRDFAFAHECAHHTLGHTQRLLELSMAPDYSLPAPLVTMWEREADCEAVRGMVKKGYGIMDIRRAMNILNTIPNQDYTYHEPGEQRIARAMGCLLSS